MRVGMNSFRSILVAKRIPAAGLGNEFFSRGGTPPSGGGVNLPRCEKNSFPPKAARFFSQQEFLSEKKWRGGGW